MKKIKLLLIAVILMLFIPIVKADDNNVRLYLFHQSTCPHCKEEIKFLNSIKDEYKNLDIVMYEVDTNEMNYNFYVKVKTKMNIGNNGVPFTVIGNDYYVGFSSDDENVIRKSIEKALKTSNYIDVISKIKNDEDISDIKYNVDLGSVRSIPLLGEVDTKKVSLPLISITYFYINRCGRWI